MFVFQFLCKKTARNLYSCKDSDVTSSSKIWRHLASRFNRKERLNVKTNFRTGMGKYGQLYSYELIWTKRPCRPKLGADGL